MKHDYFLLLASCFLALIVCLTLLMYLFMIYALVGSIIWTLIIAFITVPFLVILFLKLIDNIGNGQKRN